jgi:hypothetical protein
MGPWMGTLSSFEERELHKGAEEYQVVLDSEIIWACIVAGFLRHSSSLRVQVAAKEQMGPCSRTVFQGNIIAILLNGAKG